MTLTNREGARAWSLIDQRPIFFYHPRSDAHLVFWQGIMMTRDYALMITGREWRLNKISLKMHRNAYAELIRAYRLEAFGHQQWDAILNEVDHRRYYGLIRRFLLSRNPNLLTDLKKQYTVKQALEWFQADNEQVLDD
jgi:hypothetical protein